MPDSVATYEEAVHFLFEFIDFEKVGHFKYDADSFDLSRVEALMAALGSPHHAFPAAHVAGTKGKGSTAIMIRSIMAAAGKRAGLFTQPHLVEMTERAAVNGAPISRAAVVEIVNEMLPFVSAVRRETPRESPTFFDLITALAFRHFAREAVDFGVIEVGMGGRLDSTNVCRPAVCAIALIDFDHVAYLGDTLGKIAFEKAGIIKPGVPVVSWPQPPEAEAVIRRVAEERGAPLFRVGRDVTVSDVRGRIFERLSVPHVRDGRATCGPVTRFRVQGTLGDYPDLEIPLLGRHQAVNAALAVAAVERLTAQGMMDLTPEIVARGLARVEAPARMEVFDGPPLTLLDGAHNVVSVRSVCEVLDEHFADRRVILVFAAAADKDVAGMLALLLPRVARAVFTRSSSPRSMDPDEALRLAREAGGAECESAESAADALQRARELAGPDDVILITGSFYLAGLLRPML